MKEDKTAIAGQGSEFSARVMTPRLLFLFCMEHPLSPPVALKRLRETGLCQGCEREHETADLEKCIIEILEYLRAKGILYRHPDGSFELIQEVEYKLRNEISRALTEKRSGDHVADLLREEAHNFIERARSIRKEFEAKVFEALEPEYHDLDSQRAREIVLQLWDDVDHKRIYSSLHSIFDMLPLGIIDFGIKKEEIALEERFFQMSDDEMCDHMIGWLKDLFAERRETMENQCCRYRKTTLPEIMEDFREFLKGK